MKKRFENKTNILLVNITRLGDMIQSTPTIIGLKQENPNAKITVLVEKQFESICYSIPEIDEVIPIDLGMTVRSISREGDGIIDAYEYVDELVEKLKSKNFDYCLNMSSSAYTALLLSLVDVKRRGGWTADSEGYRLIESDWAKLFATAVFHQNRKYSPFNLVDIFRCAGDVEKHPNYLKVAVSDEAREYCKKFIQDAKFTNTGPLLVVQAGASQAKRQWAPSNFIKCVRKLVKENNVRVVLSGTKKELSIIEPIKVVSKFAKEHPALEIRVGYIDNELADTKIISDYATIPSMEGLLTMFAGGLIEHVRNLSIGLNLYAEKLEEGGNN